MSGRMSPALACVTAVALAAAAGATGPGGAPPPALEFHRVHVPAGRLGDVPLGGDRHVPLPLADFDAAVARAQAAAGVASAEPAPPATAARWRMAIDATGRLAGSIACDVAAAAAGPGRVLPLGGLRVSRGVLAAEPPREATICGRGDDLAVAIPEPGTYELEFTCGPVATDAAVYRLPLVPALATTLVLELPPGLRPVLSGPAARRAVVAPPAADSPDPWRIALGPAADLTIAVEPRDQPPPRVAVWADVVLSAPRASLAATIVPAAPWRAGRLVLEQDPALRITEIRALDDAERIEHESAADGGSISIIVPRWLDGSRTPVLVRGVVPATGSVWRLPLLRAGGNAWAGGGSVVRVDPAFVVRDLELEDCRVVPPATAAPWPRDDRDAGAVDAAPAAAGAAALYHVEHQGPAATLAVTLGPRIASFDVARVTTVEITDGAVLGRAACDVRVAGGEAFEIGGRVAPGWIIDAIDAFDPEGAAETALDDRAPVVPDRAIDWRVLPSPVGDALRIDLPAGGGGPRGIGLRISGHRSGLAPGAVFTTSDIDMVRLDGEAAGTAVIDLRTDADGFVEIAGRPAGWFEVTGRLAALVEEGQARGRIRGGDQAGDVEARVVRRRPPLDARVDVRLEPRGGALVQTFTFHCRAAAGVESLVVDFSEPGGDGLAWRVDSPGNIAVSARPLDPAEGGLASRSDAVAASWLVELSPPATGPVRIRAVRSVSFTAALPVPLAWVEGAVDPGGTVEIAAPAGARPRVANRWLRELPADATTTAASADFAYGPPRSGVAADLAPVASGADARAWAWRESVACWCDESGTTETESRFDVENEGRDALALALAPGRRLESVLVDGAAVPDPEYGPAAGTWRIPLPPGQRRVEVVVRTLAAGAPGRGAWRVEPAGCGLDVPVLDRDVRLLLPPDLAVATAGAAPDDVRPSWTARLFGTEGATTALAEAAGPTGYRGVTVASSGDRGRGVLVVSRRRLRAAACLAAVVCGAAVFLRGRRRPATAGVVVAAAAVAALWVPPAFMPVARAAWWGGLVGLAWALRPAWRWPRAWPRRGAAIATGAAGVLVAANLAAAIETDVRVFVTTGSGGDVALVPEPLFRALAAFATPEAASIRVLGCRIDVGADAAAPWRLAIEVDADAGGTLELDAGPDAAWQPPRAEPGGIAVRASGRRAQLAADAAGRRVVELAVVPAIDRRGPVETATLWIPVAPESSLRLAEEPAAGALACERAAAGSAFTPAPLVAGGVGTATFDVSVAARVRLVRPVDPDDRLAAGLRAAASVDSLSWDGGGCAVEAAFDIDTESAWLRSFVVRVDPRLEGLAAVTADGAAPRLEPLGGGRLRVELPEPVRGRAEVRLTARLPLADPVGVFDAPAIWLEGVPAEQRTTRLAAADDLEATLDPPPAAGTTAADLAGRPAPRVIVRRRAAQLRGAQTLAVSFTSGGARLTLEAQLDASSVALTRIPLDVPVAGIIDRVTLLSDDPAEPGDRRPVGIEWTRSAADRVLVLVQRPRPGRYRLEVEARLLRRPAPRGRLPLVRARLGAAVPLLVTGAAQPPLVITLEPADAAGRANTVELADAAAAPEYALTTAEAPATEPAAPADARDAGVAAGVEWAEVQATCDGRGRLHGLARFDVVTAAPVVRLRLPPGMRLFDVLVDGRVVAAEPRAIDAWDVPLGAAAWPRTILAVFAGDVGRAVADGRPLALAPPDIEGLSAADVHWRLRPPAGCALKVAPPARLLEPRSIDFARAAAGARIAADCERLAGGAVAPDRLRLESLAALRRTGTGSAAEAAWVRAGGWDAAMPIGAVTAGAAPIVIRVAPLADTTLPARAAATLVLVATAGLAWTNAARRRARRDRD